MSRSVVIHTRRNEPLKRSLRATSTNHSSRSISNTPSLHLPVRECNNPFPLRHGRSGWTPQHCRGSRFEATELGLRLSERRKRGTIFSAHRVLLYWFSVRVRGGQFPKAYLFITWAGWAHTMIMQAKGMKIILQYVTSSSLVPGNTFLMPTKVCCLSRSD